MIKINDIFGTLHVYDITRNSWKNKRYSVRCTECDYEFITTKKLLLGKNPHCKKCCGSKSIEYKIWSGIIQRCTNKNRPEYKYYGGKGISVCSRWRTFHGFISSFPRRPSKEYSIDRINHRGNYEPSNCQWVSRLYNSTYHRSSSLTDTEISEIKKFLLRGFPIQAIATFYNIKVTRVRNIKNKKTYKI